MSTNALGVSTLAPLASLRCGCLQAGLSVDVLAYGGSEPLAAILENRRITLYAVPDPCATDTAAHRLLTATASLEAACWFCIGQHHCVRECARRPAVLRLLPRTVALPLKAVFQTLMMLLMMLFWLPAPDVLLLQVPMLRYLFAVP